VTLASSTPNSYTVTYTVAASGGCPIYTTTASIAVTAPRTATISYAGSPYCQNAGTASVTRVGSAGGTYSATPAGLSITAGNGQVNLGASTPGSYTVTYTIAASGGCPSFSTTAGITVDAATTYYNDTDGDGFGDPADFTTSCSPVGGHVLDSTDDCPVLFGKIGDSCDDSDPNTVNDLINASCVCVGTNAPWYSQGSGTFADPIWSQNIGGPGATATLDAGSSVIIQAGHAVSLSAAQDVADITIAATASLTLGSNTLNVHGTSMAVNGTLAGGTGLVVLQPTTAATLSGTGTLNFYDLTVDAPAGLNCTANANIRGTLLLDDGAFTATGAVTLISNATLTGRLGPVGATASYVGNLTANRYIPAGATNWRMMGSPVAGQTVNSWKDDYFTAGFPGSHYPNFYSPTNSTNLWPSIRWYDETHAGAATIDGLTGVSNNTQALTMGQGFATWCGTSLATTTAFTVDMTGAPHIASSPITLPMTYTNTGVPATDGWNMVSNPLPSPVRFDQLVLGANVEDYITYFDPATGNNATFDISLGVGINGGTNVIQSSQAFWLKANGPAVTTTVSESAKVASNSGGFFGGDQIQVPGILRLRLSSAINQFNDETMVVFSEGTPVLDGDDVPKFVFAHPEAPQIATVSDAGDLFAINCYGPYSTDITIPMRVNVAVNGEYTITATGLDGMGLSCLRIEDLSTGDITPLEEGSTYTFTALATDDENMSRFLLHATAPLVFDVVDATCAGRDDGMASVEIANGPVHIQWIDEGGLVLLDQEDVPAGTSSIAALEAGEYMVRVFGNSGCGVLKTMFRVEEPAAMEAEAITEPSLCPNSEDGSIDLTVLGGTAPFTYLWSNGSTDEDLTVIAGTYTVDITDANGCAMAPQEYVVGAGEGPEASISVTSSAVMVNDEVAFYSAGPLELDHSWDFGDGNTSDVPEPVHAFELPGNYTVSLTVDDGDCASTDMIEISVDATTGLATIVGPTYNAWVSGDQFVIEHAFDNGQPVLVRIMNTAGQLVQEHRFAGRPARLTLPTSELASGIWLVRVSNANSARTFSLPVVK
jgi:PKD repeat protein